MFTKARVLEFVNVVIEKTKPTWEFVFDWTPVVSKEAIKERFLTCSVCLEPYQEPKLLPCGHIFCKECIESTCGRSLPRRNLTCPICRQAIRLDADMVQDLPDSYLAKDLMQFVNSTDTSDDRPEWRLENDFNDIGSLPRKLWFGDVCLRIPEDIIAILKVLLLLLSVVASMTMILTWLLMLCWILIVKLLQVCLMIVIWPVNLLLTAISTILSWTLVLFTTPFSWFVSFTSWFFGQCIIPLVWCWEHFARCILLLFNIFRLSLTAVHMVLPIAVLVLMLMTLLFILSEEDSRDEFIGDRREVDMSDIE